MGFSRYLGRGTLRGEARLTSLGLVVTVCGFTVFVVTDVQHALRHLTSPIIVLAFGCYLALIAMLVYGGLVYQVTRASYLRRLRGEGGKPQSPHRDELSAAPRVVALIPSYREEPEVVRQAVLSAALQRYPARRVVLLIDDPPNPSAAADLALLEAARALPGEVEAMLAPPRRQMTDAVAAFDARARTYGGGHAREEALILASHYEAAAEWFEQWADHTAKAEHASHLFSRIVLGDQARQHRHTAAGLRARRDIEWSRVVELYRQLGWLFAVEVTSFERKAFVNLSQAPNKAMNLNSYIGLIGRRYDTRSVGDGLHLEERPDGAHGVTEADYVLTLDADSLLVPDYASSLVAVMEAPGNERLAVAQTPYSAIPGAPGKLERLAGATTDMQYIVHQGFTAHDAAYWVGANALLRKRALDEIVVEQRDESGLTVRKFIQDRTVIEDTESSVDLIERGWRLHNHPQRLSYSATPQDYGALIIQRRRWANGGLIILPKLLRYLVRGSWRPRRLLEGALRVHYLTSIAAANVAFLVLALVPSPDWLFSYWLPVTAAPYFILYGRDMREAGYRRFDVVRVYSLNVLLVAANLGGVCKSLHQAVTGRPTAFKRTPKVADRTAAPALYVAAPALLMLYLAGGLVWDLAAARWTHAALGVVTVALLGYALCALVGVRAAIADLSSPVRGAAGRLPAVRRLRPSRTRLGYR